MKATSKLVKAFDSAVWVLGDAPWVVELDEEEREAGVQAVLDEMFPPPGDNPLAHNTALVRSSTELSKLRQVLLQADTHEHTLRVRAEYMARHESAAQPDPEMEQIITCLAGVRRALTPWASAGWVSMNAQHDETEQA